MSKENAGAEPREKTAVAFPLTVAAKGTRNPRRYGYVARMRQQAAERRQSLAVARKPTVTGQQSSSRRAAAEFRYCLEYQAQNAGFGVKGWVFENPVSDVRSSFLMAATRSASSSSRVWKDVMQIR
ncbi:MAG: hypothetical protein IPJ30_16320 [Acidobacteria bacterium]|nr:hypothetical protein [Acidobacteriota bacterium]